MATTMINDYLHTQKTMEEKYGKNTIVLYQVGSFYEVYERHEPVHEGYAKVVSNITKSAYVQKQNTQPNIYQVGFPVNSVKRFLEMLVSEHKYTVVTVEQKEKQENGITERFISNVYSPGTFISDESDSNVITSVYFDKSKTMCTAGVVQLDVITGEVKFSEIHDNHQNFVREELFRIIKSENSSELVLCSNASISFTNISTRYKNYDTKYNNQEYQESVISKIYPGKGLNSSIEEINMQYYNWARIALVTLLEFTIEHNRTCCEKIQYPQIMSDDSLILHNTALYQLQLVNENKDLLDVIDKTSTFMGKRALKKLLTKPMADTNDINKMYNDVQFMIDNINYSTTSNLRNMIDIEKYMRKIAIHDAKYMDVKQLIETVNVILGIEKELRGKISYSFDPTILNEFWKKYIDIFDMSNSNNYFMKNVHKDVDKLEHEINFTYNSIEDIRLKLSLCISEKTKDAVKFEKKGDVFAFYTTESRSKTLIKNWKNSKNVENQINISKDNKRAKISSGTILTLFDEYKSKTDNLANLVDIKLNEHMDEILTYQDAFLEAAKFIAYIDILNSHASCAKSYNYIRPCINNKHNGKSYINARNVRHPLIERLDHDTLYNGNDVNLDTSTSMLLYGVNGSGKSCYSKSIGMNIVMAQMGMFVPADSFEFYPYKRLYTRISSDDNIYKGHSSFQVEMNELKSILDHGNKNSLVIGDEVCKGTEDLSALSIVAATCNWLHNKDVTFVFATHLHALPENEYIKQINISIKHMGVSTHNDTITFDRELRDGKGKDVYGLEIAKCILNNKDFITVATDIRNKLKNIRVTKRSKYNQNVIVDNCTICKCTDELETHHIKFQSEVHENTKNTKSNLVVLCKNCHNCVHNGTITIQGWNKTTNGTSLKYISHTI